MKEELLEKITAVITELANEKIPAVLFAEMPTSIVTVKNVDYSVVGQILKNALDTDEDLQEEFLNAIEESKEQKSNP